MARYSYSITAHQDLRTGETTYDSDPKSTAPVVPPGDSGFSTPQNERPLTWADLGFPQKQR